MNACRRVIYSEKVCEVLSQRKYAFKRILSKLFP